jgi:hypothetical protein
VKKENKIWVPFKNEVCKYAFNICTAPEKFRCTPISTQDWLEWKKEALKRSQSCGYLGLELSMEELMDRKVSKEKADKCKYLQVQKN